jgi:hypothetical protein
MKLRFERGALADLDEILHTLRKTIQAQRPNLSRGSNKQRR